MKDTRKRDLLAGIVLVAAFALWTVAIRLIDVQNAGPLGSEVGFATINGAIHEATGVKTIWYKTTNYLGYFSILTAVCFACLGVYQLIRRKSLLKVDREILALGCLYVVLAVCYLLFEFVIISERPVTFMRPAMRASSLRLPLKKRSEIIPERNDDTAPTMELSVMIDAAVVLG